MSMPLTPRRRTIASNAIALHQIRLLIMRLGPVNCTDFNTNGKGKVYSTFPFVRGSVFLTGDRCQELHSRHSPGADGWEWGYRSTSIGHQSECRERRNWSSSIRYQHSSWERWHRC